MIDANNKRIAKNTLFLYIRMLLIIFVNLYTVRIVLQELGTEDYGIYNLVGGVVAMFSFLSQSLSSASQRFFALEIGKNNSSMLASIVNTTLWTYIFLAIIIFGIGQLLGSWFLNEKLTTIPLDRVSTANFVFNCSMISLVVSLLSVPFNALIIANEKMNVYSYISIFEVVFKLISVFLLQLYVGDKLRLYALMLLLSTSIVGSLYFFYCQKNYPHIKYSRTWDKSVQKKILSFTGWNMFDSMANVMNTQGMNIFLGYFFGPLVNAGRGVAYQVSVTLNQFVLNFVTATKPQIVKYYAQNELAAMQSLVFRSSKFSFYLLAVVTIPFFLNAELLFQLWLGDVPDYVVEFTKLILVAILIDVVSYPLMAHAQATGKVKLFSASIGVLKLCNLPIAYILLSFGGQPSIVFLINIGCSILCLLFRLLILRKLDGFPIVQFGRRVLLPILLVSLITAIIPNIMRWESTLDFGDSIIRLLIVGGAFLAAIFFIGITIGERVALMSLFKSKIAKG